MALPRINETLNFTMTIPSTGQRVKYRPYLVKEEKILLQAFESKDMHMCLSAMGDTLKSCLDERESVDINKLTTFDIEYMFTQLRSKSVGETSTIRITCDCGEPNDYVVDLDALSVETPERSNPNYNLVEITDNIRVEMQYPNYEKLLETTATYNQDVRDKNSNNILKTLSSCISAVLTEEERIEAKDQSAQEMEEFLSSMTASQMKGLTDFVESAPKLKHLAEFDCTACGKKNSLELSGLSDFF